MRSRVCRKLVVGSTAALLVMVGTVACGSDEPDPPAGAGSTSDSPPSSEATTGSETGTTEASASVEPATGKLIDGQKTFTFRMPSELDWSFDSTGGVADADGGIFNIIADETRSYDATLEEEVETVFGVLEDYGAFAKYQREEDITVGGVKGWVITASDKRQGYYQFGTVHKGRNASLEFEYPSGYANAEAIIASVLASVEWK